MKRSGYLIFLAFSLLMALDGDSAVDMTDYITARFRVIGIRNGNWNDIVVESKPGTFENLVFKKRERSERWIEYHGPREIVFYREGLRPEEEHSKKLARTPIGTCLGAAAADELLLVFVSRGVPKFDIYAIDDSKTQFPAESLVVINVTGVPLLSTIGSEYYTIPKGPSESIDLRPFHGQELTLAFYLQIAGQHRLVFENNYDAFANTRSLLVLDAPKRKGSHRIQVYSIVESLTSLSLE